MPLLGKQPQLAQHMKEITKFYEGRRPSAILVISAHWESSKSRFVQITSNPKPGMIYDYSGFPSETYQYKYPAPGSPEIAAKIQTVLNEHGIHSELDPHRGFDHGVFVPLMLMEPEADIPVVCLSLDSTLDVNQHIAMGRALKSFRQQNPNVLLLGSGYTFHNMHAFFHPSPSAREASRNFQTWLQQTLLESTGSTDRILHQLSQWEQAPGARICHPREEHLLPLFVVAASSISEQRPGQLIYEENKLDQYAVSGFLFN